MPGGDASLELFQDACKHKQMMQFSSDFAGKFQKGAPVAAEDRAVERGETVIFTGARDSKGPMREKLT